MTSILHHNLRAFHKTSCGRRSSKLFWTCHKPCIIVLIYNMQFIKKADKNAHCIDEMLTFPITVMLFPVQSPLIKTRVFLFRLWICEARYTCFWSVPKRGRLVASKDFRRWSKEHFFFKSHQNDTVWPLNKGNWTIKKYKSNVTCQWVPC